MRSALLRRKTDAWPLLGLGALACWLFRDVLFGGRAFYERDIHLQWYGQVQALVRAVAEGSWPVWNPNVGFGQPLWANPNTEPLYPATWLNLVLQPWSAYTVFAAAHALLSGAGLYLLARRFGASRAGALTAASVWMAGGPLLSLVNVWNHLAGASWLPWIVLAADGVATPTPARALALGAALAAPILAGSPDMAFMGWALAALQGARRIERRSRTRALRQIGWGLGAALFALGLSAGQWVPTLALLHGTLRAHLPAEVRTYWSLHPVALLQALFPVPLGDLPLAGSLRAALFESREPFLRSLYLGLPAFGLLAGTLSVARAPHRAFLLGVAGVSTLLALGPRTPLYAVAVRVLPPLEALRFPAKLFVVPAFAWALLVGLGVDAWAEPASRARRLLLAHLPLAALGLLAAGGSLAAGLRADEWGALVLFRTARGPSFAEILRPTAQAFASAAAFALVVLAVTASRRLAPRGRWLAAVVAVADLAVRHDGLNPTSPRALLAYRPPAVGAIEGDGGRRIYVFDYPTEPGSTERYLHRESAFRVPLARLDPRERWIEALALREYLLPPVAAAWGLQGSFEADRLKIQPADVARLTDLLHAAEGSPLHGRLLQLAGVTHVVALHQEGLEGLTPVAVLPGHFLDPIRVFRVPDPLPEVYAVAGARIAPWPAAFETLADPSFDPRREVILDSGVPGGVEPPLHAATRVIERRADRLRIEAELSRDGYVVTLGAYSPAWRGWIDGQTAEVVRANVAFRAVRVPAGRHVVELRCRPAGVLVGLGVSAGALGLAAAVGLLGARRGSVAA